MNFEQAKERAVRFIALSKKTVSEVEKKLANLKVEQEIVKEVIEYLSNLGYLDDADYVDSFIRQNIKMEKLSIYEIKQKLLIKGINKELISEKVDKLYETGYEAKVVNKLLLGKLSNMEKVKQMSYIYRRGFRVNE